MIGPILGQMQDCINQCIEGAITEMECLAKLSELHRQAKLRYVAAMLGDALADLNI